MRVDKGGMVTYSGVGGVGVFDVQTAKRLVRKVGKMVWSGGGVKLRVGASGHAE